jgi:hypothetical protein
MNIIQLKVQEYQTFQQFGIIPIFSKMGYQMKNDNGNIGIIQLPLGINFFLFETN